MKAKVSERRLRALPLLGICLLTVCAFLPTFWNGFQMEWDDQWMVMNPQTVGRWDIYLLKSIFMVPSHGQIGPLNQLMYTALYHMFGFNPFVFHMVSLLLHMANVCLLYVGLSMILQDCLAMDAGRIYRMAFITTVLFAVHPLQVESVAWISASKILLSTSFYFMGAIMVVEYLRKGSRGSYACALLMQLLAYLSKEQAVVFPLFVALLYVWYGVRPVDRRFWRELLPFCLLGIVCVLHEVFYVSGYNHYIQGDTYVWWKRVIFFFYSVATYFFKWLVPTRLSWMYLFPVGMNDSMPWWLVSYPVLVAFLVYASWNWVRRPLVLSALAFFLVHLLLVLHIAVLPRASVIADRYMYISIIGLNLVCAYYLTGIKEKGLNKTIFSFIVITIFVLLVGMSFSRTMDWKSSRTLRMVAISMESESGRNAFADKMSPQRLNV